MDNIVIAKELLKVAKMLTASDPGPIPWTFHEQIKLKALIEIVKKAKENTQKWIKFYESGEGKNYGYDSKKSLEHQKVVLAKASALQRELETALKTMEEFENLFS